MELLLLWLFCGLAAAAVYRNKGRSWGVGLAGGLLLGPIGLVLALVSGGGGPRCPHCAERIHHDARVCKHCGRDVL